MEKYRIAVLLLLAACPVAALMLLKWPAAVETIQAVLASGTLHSKSELIPVSSLSPWARPFARTVSYLYVIRWALFYGLLISSVVRTFVNPRKLTNRVAGGIAGVPLMLCSCCVAPLAVSTYRRSSKLGPAVALLLSAPSLNPAALILTFILFPMKIGIARMLMALFIVFVVTGLITRGASGSGDEGEIASFPARNFATPSQLLRAFVRALGKTILQTIPFIAIGVLLSMTFYELAPIDRLSYSNPALAILLISIVAVPMALPTFSEIPLAIALTGAHAPAGAVAAFLFAGPAINLPSLFTLGKAAGPRVAWTLAGSVLLVAFLGGIALGH